MKNLALSILMVFWTWSSLWAEAGIPEENQTILVNQDQHNGPRSGWVPSKTQTHRALETIVTFLNQTLSPEWKNRQRRVIRKRFSSYHVQFVGIIVDGQKALHCNFFPADDGFKHDTKSYVYVLDGGASYWRINVNTEEDTCFDFDVNGEG